MGRIEQRRLAALERRAEQGAWQAATMRLPDDVLRAITPYAERVLEADKVGAGRPRPTPEEQQALDQWYGLYERARLEGWGQTDELPALGHDDLG